MKKLFNLFMAVAISMMLIFIACSEVPIKLDGVEVTEYQGENLSSINNFRENSIEGPQYIDINNYTLKVNGLVEKPLNLTYDEAINNHTSYQKVVTLNCVEGWSVKILWEGILVNDLIKEAGYLPETTVVIFHAYDGYTSSLPLQYITDRNILIAYKMNGLVIPAERGFPFQLVAENKLGYKWVKWITRIELSSDTNYKGYWESRGFSNEANIP